MQADQVSVNGENFIGLLGMATDRYAILSPEFKYESILDVPTLRTRIYGTTLAGMFCAGNSNGLILPYFIEDNEYENLKSFLAKAGARVLRIDDRFTAIGNMLSCNDKRAYVSSSLTRDYKEIEDVLGVEVVTGDVAGHIEVGAYVTATNRGFIAHPDAEDHLKNLAEVFKVNGMIGTVNCGVPYVKSGLIANSNGYLAGGRTTPIEMQRIEDALGFM
jgi:translation initiation factor 6